MNACHHINDTPTKTFNLLGKKEKNKKKKKRFPNQYKQAIC